MGNDYNSRQPFTMDAIMHPDADDPIGKRLSFHFPLPIDLLNSTENQLS